MVREHEERKSTVRTRFRKRRNKNFSHPAFRVARKYRAYFRAAVLAISTFRTNCNRRQSNLPSRRDTVNDKGFVFLYYFDVPLFLCRGSDLRRNDFCDEFWRTKKRKFDFRLTKSKNGCITITCFQNISVQIWYSNRLWSSAVVTIAGRNMKICYNRTVEL